MVGREGEDVQGQHGGAHEIQQHLGIDPPAEELEVLRAAAVEIGQEGASAARGGQDDWPGCNARPRTQEPRRPDQR